MLCKKHSGVPNQSLQTEFELAPCQSGILAHNTSVGSRSNWRLCPERHQTNSTSTTGPTQPPSEKPTNPPVDQPTQQHCIWGPRTKNKLFTLPPKPPRTPDQEELRNPPDLGAPMNSTNDTWLEPLETTKWASYPGCKWPGEVAGSDLKGPNASRSWVYFLSFTFFFKFCGPKMTYVESWHMSIDIPRISLLFMQTSIKYTTVSVGTISKI